MKATTIARKTTDHRATSYAISRFFIPVRLLSMVTKRIAISAGSPASDILSIRRFEAQRGQPRLVKFLRRTGVVCLINEPMERYRY